MNSGIIGKGIEGVAQVADITGEAESSRDKDLAKEGKLTDVVILDLFLGDNAWPWRPWRRVWWLWTFQWWSGSHGVGYHGLALVGSKCSPLMVIHPSIFVPCLPFHLLSLEVLAVPVPLEVLVALLWPWAFRWWRPWRGALHPRLLWSWPWTIDLGW